MKIAILKLSGKALDSLYENDSLTDSINQIRKSYEGLIIVHGAGKNITEWSDALGIASEFVNGQRVSSKKVVEVVAAVQAGVINAQLTGKLVSSGLTAIGLTGIDKGTFTAEYISEKLGYVGRPLITGSAGWIKEMLKDGLLPVFSSLCIDKDGNLMNVNADLFTEALAEAVGAESVFFVSDIEGVMLHGDIKSRLSQEEIMEGIKAGEITGGMIPKLNSCVKLLDQGIKKIWIGPKNFENLVKEGNYNGTWIVQSA